jgi:hypothetical protein
MIAFMSNSRSKPWTRTRGCDSNTFTARASDF